MSHVSHHDLERYQRRDPFEKKAASMFSRAKRQNGGRPNGYISGRQLRALLESQRDPDDPERFICPYCHGSFLERELEVDHKVPLSRPGGVNAIWNVCYCCVHDNRAKRDLTAAEYVAYRALMERQPPLTPAELLAAYTRLAQLAVEQAAAVA